MFSTFFLEATLSYITFNINDIGLPDDERETAPRSCVTVLTVVPACRIFKVYSCWVKCMTIYVLVNAIITIGNFNINQMRQRPCNQIDDYRTGVI